MIHTIKYYDAIPFENGGGEVDKKDGTILEFLHGSHSFQGVWFGDNHPTLKGNFWWRKFLPTDQFIASSQDGQGWIAVEDGLPEFDKKVLGYYELPATDAKKKPTGEVYRYYIICHVDKVTQGSCYKYAEWLDSEHNAVTPTHWQPLPRPPKK